MHQLPNHICLVKTYVGDFDHIVTCIACHEGCTGGIFSGRHITCINNQFLVFESKELPAVEKTKRL